jgi:hypothetical protein
MYMKAILFLASSVIALAGPITYTFTGSVTGTLGSTTFSNAALTATLLGDTTNALPDGGGGFVNDIGAGLASISIAGVGSGTFTDLMYAFSCPPCSGFIELQAQIGGKGALTFTDPAFLAYDLTTAIGPIHSAGPTPAFFLPWSDATSFGTFNITSIQSPTFQATLGAGVPEPGTLVLVSAALLLLGITRRRLHLRDLLVVPHGVKRRVN